MGSLPTSNPPPETFSDPSEPRFGHADDVPALSQPSAPHPRLPLGVRLTIYVASVVLSILALSTMPTELTGHSLFGGPYPWLMFLQEALLFGGAFLPACLLALLEHRDVANYGLPWRRFLGTRFWQGCLLGLAEIGALIGSIAALGGYRFGSLAILETPAIAKWLLFWFAFFVVVGLYEEFMFRGYLQFTLANSIGFWPAAILLSLGFGCLHLFNRGETWVGAASVAVVGLVFALALKRTGDLWFVVGWHAAFDFGETFLFSVPNSGALFSGHLSNATLQGPAWLTGGTVGPEGSVFSFLIMGATALLVHFLFPGRESAHQVRN